jgi:hypothetical protein
METVATDMMNQDIASSKLWGCDTTCITENKCDSSADYYFGSECVNNCFPKMKCPAPFKVTQGKSLAALEEPILSIF